VLAYLAWHRPAAGVDRGAYEQALERFHRSLAHSPPSGFHASLAFRAARLPWLGGRDREQAPGYEDWYLVEGWSALGVLEEAAVGRGHMSRHEAVANLASQLAGGVYRLDEGQARLERARVSVWVSPARGHDEPTLGDLLGDGMDPQAGLWRRCLGLGPAPEYCLLAPEAPAGARPTRLPAGWHALLGEREPLW
jgi:hypothetical protein